MYIYVSYRWSDSVTKIRTVPSNRWRDKKTANVGGKIIPPHIVGVTSAANKQKMYWSIGFPSSQWESRAGAKCLWNCFEFIPMPPWHLLVSPHETSHGGKDLETFMRQVVKSVWLSKMYRKPPKPRTTPIITPPPSPPATAITNYNVHCRYFNVDFSAGRPIINWPNKRTRRVELKRKNA